MWPGLSVAGDLCQVAVNGLKILAGFHEEVFGKLLALEQSCHLISDRDVLYAGSAFIERRIRPDQFVEFAGSWNQVSVEVVDDFTRQSLGLFTDVAQRNVFERIAHRNLTRRKHCSLEGNIAAKDGIETEPRTGRELTDI